MQWSSRDLWASENHTEGGGGHGPLWPPRSSASGGAAAGAANLWSRRGGSSRGLAGGGWMLEAQVDRAEVGGEISGGCGAAAAAVNHRTEGAGAAGWRWAGALPLSSLFPSASLNW
jgi:hypothetical protein